VQIGRDPQSYEFFQMSNVFILLNNSEQTNRNSNVYKKRRLYPAFLVL